MIEGMVLAAAATAVTVPAFAPKVECFVMFPEEHSVSTELARSSWIDNLLGTVTTYQHRPLPLVDADYFVSPVKRSLRVTTTIEVGGRVVQPPIEGDLVYFDE
jgi:hypothetical protein